MNSHSSPRSTSSRYFYSVAALLLLVLTIIGFRHFYFGGGAYPGRPLTPPIRSLLISHGIAMTTWILLSVVQPILIASRNRKAHMLLGRIGAVLALGLFFLGWQTGVAAIRVAPPEMRIAGLAPKEFLTVPLMSIVVFLLFVIIGVWQRKRPEIHRPMMLVATLTICSASFGRIEVLNTWYAGTALEVWFTAFLPTVLIGVALLVIKSALSKTFDRWLAIAVGMLAMFCVASSLLAKTAAWDQCATFLLR